MAKRNKIEIEESFHEGDIVELIPSQDAPIEEKFEFVEDKLIKGYKERGWDDNRIAARLMVSVDKVKSVK